MPSTLEETPLVRTVGRIGTYGKDVEAITRAQFRYLGDWTGLSEFHERTALQRRTWDPWDRARMKRIQNIEKIPQTGTVGPRTYGVLLDHMDSLALKLMAEYADSVKPKLIEPLQGFESLTSTLWDVFSAGRSRGLTDLGTFNQNSRLPSGRPSDHAVWPAFAFDLGIEPDTGWNNLKARAYAIWTAGRREVEYTILGNRIWRGRYKVWGDYWSGGHLNHVHVSGWR